MLVDGKLLIGKNDKKSVCLIPKMANRHGLITGASGSGKTLYCKKCNKYFENNNGSVGEETSSPYTDLNADY